MRVEKTIFTPYLLALIFLTFTGCGPSLAEIKLWEEQKDIPSLIMALRKEDRAIYRARIVAALGETKDKKALKPLLAALNDSEPDVRRQAVESLGKLKDPKALEPLIGMLKDEVPAVREKTVEILGQTGGSGIIDPLMELLRSKEELGHIKQAAVVTIQKIGDTRAVYLMLDLLEDNDPGVRKNVAQALGKLGDSRAIVHLEKVIENDPDQKVRQEAKDSIARIKER